MDADPGIIDKLKVVLRELEEELQKAEAVAKTVSPLREQIESLKRTIRQLEGGEETEQIIKGEFARLKLIDAVIRYLEKHGGGPRRVKEEVVPALQTGGAVVTDGRLLEDIAEPYRAVMVAIGRSKVVTYDEHTDTVTLRK